MSWIKGSYFTISRGALILFCASWLIFGIWTIHESSALSDQQNRTRAVLQEHMHLNDEICRFVTALALYQPNLAPQVVGAANEIIDHSPARCFP